jgi:hypothetical protein
LANVLDGLKLWEKSTNVSTPTDLEDAWLRVQKSFVELEVGLQAQSNPMSDECDRIEWAQKVDFAWNLCDGSFWMLEIFTEENPSMLDSMRSDIEIMEGSVEC